MNQAAQQVIASGVLAALVAWVATGGIRYIAHHFGAIDVPDYRRVHGMPTPTMGGLAMLTGLLVAAAVFIPWQAESVAARGFIIQVEATLVGAVIIALLGAADDIFQLNWKIKLLGQSGGALTAIFLPYSTNHFTSLAELPLVITRFDPPLFPAFDIPIVIGVLLPFLLIVASMNMMNFIDGIDGLAAGTAFLVSSTFALLAFSYNRLNVAILAAAIAGAAIGFLQHNFRKDHARIFMGDSGSLLLGYIMAIVAVQGLLKTTAAVTLIIPLALMAVPLLDMTFVVSKRLKYRQSIASADKWHLHHRLLDRGYSQRRVAMHMWGWTLSLCVFAVALRYVDYHDGGIWKTDGLLIIGALALGVVAVSIHALMVLEIIKTKAVRERNARAREKMS